MDMGPVNWAAVILAAMLAVAIGFVWRGPLFRQSRWPHYAVTGGVMLLASAMLGHAYARIGAETLAVKPWLYLMQSGGIATAFVIPAVMLTMARARVSWQERLLDAGYWLIAYLAMGTVFWLLT